MNKARPHGARQDAAKPGDTDRPGRSGVQSLRESVIKALHLERKRPSSSPPLEELSHAELTEELNRLSWTNEKQARVIDALERMVEQLNVTRRRERRLSAREQKAVFDTQDQFLAELIEESEAALQAERADRDAALHRVEELELELEEAHTYSRQLESGAHPPRARSATAEAEVAALRRELAFARQRIEKLSNKCNLSRDTLQRVMSQRDEAHQTVRRLHGELRQVSAESTRSRAAPGGSIPAETPDSVPPGTEAIPPTVAASEGSKEEEPPRTLPATDRVARSAIRDLGSDALEPVSLDLDDPGATEPEPPDTVLSPRTLPRPRSSAAPRPSGGPSSPLAIALANTDPARRRRSVPPPLDRNPNE